MRLRYPRLNRHSNFGTKIRCCLFPLLVVLPSLAAHNPLLPRPQVLRYKNGYLPIRALWIQVASAHPANADAFAATEFQRRVFERTGVRIPMSRSITQNLAVALDRTGALDPLPEPGEQPGEGSREAYDLQVATSGVRIHSASSAGVFYGVQTLLQLIEGEGTNAALPQVDIKDWPLLAYRGVMVDMSEGQLATEKEVERQIDKLALWKVNQYYLYSEDSIELNGYPLLNPDARFSKEEIQRIVAYARRRHIDVVPCLELYGHQHDLFRIEKYSDLADFPHGGEFDPTNPELKALLMDWVDQYAALFPSRFVHIGFDETWEIARAAKKQGGNTPPAALFVDQLDLVADRFQQHGKTVMAWADMMVKYPDIISRLPRGLLAVPWYYEPDPDPEYKQWLGPLVAHNVANLVAPGVSMWNEIAPNFVKTFRNIDTFLSAGIRAHTMGLINTVWTDDQMELRRAGGPGMAYGAVAGWNGSDWDRQSFFSDYSSIMYSPQVSTEVARALEELSAAETSLEKVWGSETMIAVWHNPFEAAFWDNLKAHRDDLRQTRLLAEDAQEHFASALSLGADPADMDSLLFASRMLDYAGMKGLYALEFGELWESQAKQSGRDEDLWDRIGIAFSKTHGRVGDLMDFLSGLCPLYRQNWLAEYRPYRLATAMLRFSMEYQYWWRIQGRYEHFRQTYQKGTPLPSLSQLAGNN